MQQEFKLECYKNCQKYLGLQFCPDFKNFEISPLSGGLTNEIFIVSNGSENGTENGSSKYIYRIFGTGKTNNINEENIALAVLSTQNLAPKFYGAFENGRIEQFIQGRTLKTCELSDGNHVVEIAEKISKIHKLEMPVEKDGRGFLARVMGQFEEILDQNMNQNDINSLDKNSKKFKLIQKFKNYKTFTLKEIVSKSTSPIGYCHNDLQELNIMKTDHQLYFIDYEYAAYNFICFDLANHFCERIYNYQVAHDLNNKQGFEIFKDNYPSNEQKIAFLRAYYGSSASENSNLNIINDLVTEIDKFSLVSDIFWAGWCLVQPFSESFDLIKYCEARIDRFEEMRGVYLA